MQLNLGFFQCNKYFFKNSWVGSLLLAVFRLYSWYQRLGKDWRLRWKRAVHTELFRKTHRRKQWMAWKSQVHVVTGLPTTEGKELFPPLTAQVHVPYVISHAMLHSNRSLPGTPLILIAWLRALCYTPVQRFLLRGNKEKLHIFKAFPWPYYLPKIF